MLLASVFFTAYSHADFFGKLILTSLFGLSILCWVVLVYKVKQTKRIKKFSSSFEKSFQPNSARLLALSIEDITGGNEVHPFGNIFLSLKQKTMDILNKNHFFA